MYLGTTPRVWGFHSLKRIPHTLLNFALYCYKCHTYLYGFHKNTTLTTVKKPPTRTTRQGYTLCSEITHTSRVVLQLTGFALKRLFLCAAS